jgi:hypothetical protein
MRSRIAALILVAAVACFGAHSARAWGNRISHQRLFDASLESEAAADVLRRFMNEELGLAQRAQARLAVQLGFDDAIDDDIGPAGGKGSRLTDNLNAGDPDPDDLGVFGVDIEVTLEAAPPCARDASSEACLEERRSRGSDAAKWIRLGTWAEDNPNPRSRHHFHDPVRLHQPPAGNHGLDNSKEFLLGLDAFLVEPVALFRGGDWGRTAAGMLLFPLRTVPGLDVGNFDYEGRSAVDRALNVPLEGSFSSAADPRNLFSLADAERYLYLALRQPLADEREHYLALHFLAVGHAIHLLQDMSSVAHVRNDFINDHLISPKVSRLQALEDVGDDLDILQDVLATIREKSFESQPARFLREVPPPPPASASDYLAAVPPPLREDFDVRDLWDEISFEVAGGGGLAEFTHRNFFSAGTVSNLTPPLANGYDAPLVPSCNTPELNGPGSGPTWVARLPVRELAAFKSESAVTYDDFISSPVVPHLARCRFHSFSFGSEPKLLRPWFATVHDDSVQRDYLELLWAQTIHYASKFMESYWSPRLEVAAAPDGPEGDKGFRLRNRSRQEFRFASDAVEIVYETPDADTGTRRRVAVPIDCTEQGELSLLPAPIGEEAGPLSSFTCWMPETLPEPAFDPTSFWVVVRGAHGSRGFAGSRAEFEAGEKHFVVAFDRVLPQLLLFLHQGPDLGPDEDLRNDIWALDVDLARTLPEGEDGEITDFEQLENLTERLRGAGGSPLLDFVVPAADPRGGRIALWSDRDATYATGSLSGVAAPLRLYLYDPFEEPASLVSIPSGEVETQPDHWFLPRWSENGEALFFRAPGHARYLLASQAGESFDTEEAFSTSNDDPPEALEIGDERDVCRRIDFLSARDAAQVVVSTLCGRERVTHKEELITGGFRIDWSPITPTKREVRIAEVEPSPREPGRLHARLTHRVASGSLVSCGGNPDSCWERSGEPSGEEGAEQLSPVWAPDGSRFAFLRDPSGGDDGAVASGGEELWIADVSSGNLRRVLTRDRGDLYRLAWHPSGDRLLVGLATADRYDVVTVDPDGPETQVPGRLARFRNQGSSRFSLYAPLLLPLQGP